MYMYFAQMDKWKQICAFCCFKPISPKIYNNNDSSQDQQIEQDINMFAAFTKEELDANKMRKVLHEIRNFRTLDDTTIKCIRRLNDADKMQIIISFNDVVNSMQLIFESLLN